MNRYVCIHGHFYQPPRDNPWTGEIDAQESASPFHDWNERITAECYAPNAASGKGDGVLRERPNNYARMSFNFGPTLLAWLHDQAPSVYRAIQLADRDSRERFSGHGSALAQPYNHMILPLANRRDRSTQVLWGIRDFEHRFGRSPKGMWLPETGVDLETLEVLARFGIRFTILSPHQALRIRPLTESGVWEDTREGRIDPRRPYEARLPSGNRVAIFFYHGPLSHAVAFGELQNGGQTLARRLEALFSESAEPQLAHIATDGETYGHHQRGGDRTLAEALDEIEARGLARLTNYGEYLTKHPPAYEVEILENTAWSCAHGLGRWSEDCSCHTGMHPGWNQAWRAPLRAALDWLRDALAGTFEERGCEVFRDPWAARDGYITVVLDRSPQNIEEFLERHAARRLGGTERAFAFRLLEIQRHAMLMYTSCGWFFDDPAGLETRQILQYAARAVQLAEELFGKGLEAPFLSLLEQAKSNLPEGLNGRNLYTEFGASIRVTGRPDEGA